MDRAFLETTARRWREQRRQAATELSEADIRVLREDAEALAREIPMELLQRRELVPLLGLGLNASQSFRLAGTTQLAIGTAFDASETTLLRQPPSAMTPAARAYLIAVVTSVRAFRASAVSLLDLPDGLVVDYLADAFENHREPIGRALHLAERVTVETNLAIWRAFRPDLFTEIPKRTLELAIVHQAVPHDLRIMTLLHQELTEERTRLYGMPTEKNAITRSDGRLVTELDVWETLFPYGAEIFRVEHRPSSPP